MAKGHDKKASRTSTVPEKEGEEGPRVVGYLGRLVGEPRVKPWAPADEAAVKARVALPEAPGRAEGAAKPVPRSLPASATPASDEPDGSAAAEAREAAADLSARTAEARQAAADLSATGASWPGPVVASAVLLLVVIQPFAVSKHGDHQVHKK